MCSISGSAGHVRRAGHARSGGALGQRRDEGRLVPQVAGASPLSAAIGGAGVRVLKAFFNQELVIPEPTVASDDGVSLQPWRGAPLTVGGELNKLSFNMAFGRDTAGVHFRRDEIEEIVLGE
jgi:hypothetical protein